jgi:hypothetical protein
MQWDVIFYWLGAALMCWLAIRIIRTRPELFSKANFSKSIGTLGWLALMLIAVVALCIMLLRR